MGRSLMLLVAILVFSTFQIEETGANTTPQDDEKANYAESAKSLQILGNNYNVLVASYVTTQQRLTDIKITANSLASKTQSAVLKSLNIINSPVAKPSKACADSQSAAKTRIIGQTNEQIKAALASLDQLATVENELSKIKSRLNVNSANVQVNRLLKCKENVALSSGNVGNIINCYKQLLKDVADYIALETKNVDVQSASVASSISRTQLLKVFNDIIMSAVLKAEAEAKNVLFVCKPVSIDDEIYGLSVANVDTINSKIGRVMNLLNVINSKSSNLEAELDSGLDAYLDPMVSLLNSSLNLIPNTTSDISRDSLILPEVKAGILKNITTAVQNVLGKNASGAISKQVYARIEILKTQITKGYVESKCQLNDDIYAYNMCVKTVIKELSDTIKNISISADNLYDQTVQLNVSLSSAIANSLHTALSGVYENTLLQALNKFTKSLGSGLSGIYVEQGNSYNQADDVLQGYKVTTATLIDNTFDRIKEALDIARQMNLTIDYDKVFPGLETLKETAKEKLLNVLDNATEVGYNIVVNNHTSINVDELESILKNCSLQQKGLDQVVNNCIKPIIAQLSEELKTKLSNLKKSSQNIFNFVVRLDRDLNLLAANFSSEAFQTIKNASQDENTFAVVQLIENDVVPQRGNLQIVLDNIRTELNKVKQKTLDSIQNVQKQIANAVFSLDLSIKIVLTFNTNANLTQPKQLLEKLTYDANTLTNTTILNIVNENTGLINDLTKQYLKLYYEYKRIIAVLNESTISNRCKNQSRNPNDFTACVKSFITEYNNSVQAISVDINSLYEITKNLTTSIDFNITSTIDEVLKPIVNISDAASKEIFNKYNVTKDQVITYALSGVDQYNITNIRETSTQLIASAQEIDKRVLVVSNAANFTLYGSGTAVYDIVGIGRPLCGTSSVDKLVKGTADMVASSSKVTLEGIPDLSAVTNSLLILSMDINSSLNYQLSLLGKENLNKMCSLSLANNRSLQELHKCIVTQINKFGVYFKAESGLLRSHRKSAYEKVKGSSEQLSKWNSETVIPQSTAISNRAKQAAEDFYKNCNITVNKVLDYTLNNAKSHFNNFQARILSNATAINDLAEVVSKKNYSSPNIRSRLQSAVSPVDTAISDVLKSAKRSRITDELKIASEKLIKDGLTSYNNYIANFTINANNNKQQALNLLKIRDDIMKSHNRSYLIKTCFNASSPFPLVEVSGCTNALTYKNTFTAANSVTLNSLLSIKQQLTNYDTNWVSLTSSYANFIVNEQRKSAYYLAYRIYKSAGLAVPKDVTTAVDINRCVKRVQLTTSEFICDIVV